MAGGVDYGVEVFRGLELLEREVDGDTSLPFFLDRVEDPCKLERVARTGLFGFLRIIIYRLLVNVAGFEQEVPVSVLFPWSTWPITIRFRWGLLLDTSQFILLTDASEEIAPVLYKKPCPLRPRQRD